MLRRPRSSVSCSGRAGDCAIRLPFDAKAVLGSGRAPVLVSVNANAPRPGDRVRVTVARDDAPREVDAPAELAAAFAAAPDAELVWDGLSYTHRKEYARWVGGGKSPQTRLARAEKAVAMLRQGVRTPG